MAKNHRCRICGYIKEDSNMLTNDEGDFICTECYEDNTEVCIVCGEWFINYDTKFKDVCTEHEDDAIGIAWARLKIKLKRYIYVPLYKLMMAFKKSRIYKPIYLWRIDRHRKKMDKKYRKQCSVCGRPVYSNSDNPMCIDCFEGKEYFKDHE